MKIRLDKAQWVENCDTEKSYAIKFSRGAVDMTFLSKKFTTITEVQEQDKSLSYDFEFPDWLYDKLSNKEVIKLIIKENN